MDDAPVHRTARERARAQITAEVLAEARRQLATVGAGALSLRSVARELGMVSSALYRYFDSRDALLTRLIIDAYDALGEAAEQAAAAASTGSDLDRWRTTAGAIRVWAVDHPHEYALLYGSPVPGYVAPPDTVTPGIRPSLALVAVVADAAAAGRLAPPPQHDVDPAVGAGALAEPLAADLGALARRIGADLPPDTMLAVLTAWTQLFGLLSFELFNQTRDMVSDNGLLFDAAVTSTGRAAGLR